MEKQRKILRLSYLAIFCLVLFSQAALAQKKVTGIISDKKSGEPLYGASVVVVGSETIGASTDFDGKYTVEVPEGATQLMFSYLGFVSQTLEITGTEMNVALEEETEVLNEVVVVGYGTQKSKEVTSAVATVSSDDFNGGNISSPVQLLQGKVSGLSIAKPGGDPNGGFNIRLRGISTFGQNVEPLIVINGVPGADLSSVDPNDIESMTILKDASATSIYGARGTSGVILIKTKKGRKGTAKVEYSAALTTESVSRAPQVLTAEEFRSLPNTVDLDSSVTTNWMDEVSRRALTHVHNLSLSGGNDKSNYRIALNYRNNQGVVLNSGFERLNGQLNFNQKALNDKLNINVDLSSTVNKADYAINEALQFAARYNPTAPVYSDDPAQEKWGGYFQRDAFFFYNPVAILEQNNKGKTSRNILGRVKGEYEILKGLKFSMSYSQNRESGVYDEYWSKKSFWTPFGSGSNKGYARRDWNENLSTIFDMISTYERDFSGLNFKLMVGHAYQVDTRDVFGARGQDFLTDKYNVYNLGAGRQVLANAEAMYSYKEQSKLAGIFSRLSLNWKDLAFMTANIRRDAASRFGVGRKALVTPGVSAGINLGKMFSIKNVPSLKLRAGYGESGNLPPYPYLSQLLFGPSSEKFYYNGQYVQAFSPIRNDNPDLGWEVKKEFNAGVDFGLFDYKINGKIDYFRSISSELLLEFKVPVPPNPSDKKWLNVGELENSGLEFALGGHIINKKDLHWAADLTYTKFFDTKLRKITNNETESAGVLKFGDLGAPFLTGIQTVRVEEGKALGQIVGPVFTGIDSAGVLQYKDIDGDGLFDANADVEVIGHALPKFQMGLSNTVTYKNFDFNIFFRGVFGHDLVNVNNARYGVPVVLGVQSGMKSILDYKDATNGPVFSDVYVEKASFVKLDNATIGYTFKLKEGGQFSKLRLTLSGQNLLTFTKYTGLDPEVRYADYGNPLVPGIDRPDTYFATRSFTFGLNVGF